MRIGLFDVDGHHFPNLPLMKLSSWHKMQGDSVDWYFAFMRYDRVYASKVFTFSRLPDYVINADEFILRGTGTIYDTPLPDEIEKMYPDYSLYPEIQNTAYGFLTRGCPRACPFCIVGKKEGLSSRQVAQLGNFWRGQRYIKLLDPNLLACPNHIQLLEELKESGASVDFTQGLDARLINDRNASLIRQINVKMVHFAWDLKTEEERVLHGLQLFKKIANFPYRKQRCYVLTNFNTEIEYDLYRVYTLKSMGYDPFVMVYSRETASPQIKRLQRWVNNKIIFNSCARFEYYRG